MQRHSELLLTKLLHHLQQQHNKGGSPADVGGQASIASVQLNPLRSACTHQEHCVAGIEAALHRLRADFLHRMSPMHEVKA